MNTHNVNGTTYNKANFRHIQNFFSTVFDLTDKVGRGELSHKTFLQGEDAAYLHFMMMSCKVSV